MSDIPNNTVIAKDLADWFIQKLQLAKLRASEMLLRQKIYKHYFPAAKEGTNKVTLPDSYILKAGRVVDRKLDEPVLATMWDEFVAAGINMNELIRKKPELNLTAYRELTHEQRNLFDQALTIKDGSPSLSIEPPKAAKPKAGEQAS